MEDRSCTVYCVSAFVFVFWLNGYKFSPVGCFVDIIYKCLLFEIQFKSDERIE